MVIQKIIYVTEPKTLFSRIKDWFLTKFCQMILFEEMDRRLLFGEYWNNKKEILIIKEGEEWKITKKL